MACIDEFTRIVDDEWFGTVCPDDKQEEMFTWLYKGACVQGRVLCTDLESDAHWHYSHVDLIKAAVDKYFPGHTDVKPAESVEYWWEPTAWGDDLLFKGTNADGECIFFVFNFFDHGYYLSLSFIKMSKFS